MKVNDRVQYSRAWLRSTCSFTGNLPRAKGTIREIKEYGKTMKVARIEWDLPDVPAKVAVCNLELLKS